MYIFIYGTLKSTEGNNYILAGADSSYVGEAETVEGYTLKYQMYPELHKSRLGVVVGELWEVSEDGLEVLDRFEGVPSLYYRAPINIKGIQDECQAYFKTQ